MNSRLDPSSKNLHNRDKTRQEKKKLKEGDESQLHMGKLLVFEEVQQSE
jgi:hypothetical protein